MAGNPEGRSRGGRALLALVLAAGVAGCDGLPLPGGGAAPAPRASAPQPGTADVEAPEAFQAAEPGLWDGRPSLGGVWVAHPDVDEPERVIIRNQDNASSVVGALFRRERDLPGPSLQVSSDAAEALGMLAGAPANLSVTALRRAEAAQPEAAAAPPTPPADGAEEIAEATAAILGATGAAPGGAISTTPLDGAAAPEGATAAAALAQPFVQASTSRDGANAQAAAEALAAQGLPARAVEGGGLWRILVGPASTEAERAAFLDGVVAAGYADAYFVQS